MVAGTRWRRAGRTAGGRAPGGRGGAGGMVQPPHSRSQGKKQRSSVLRAVVPPGRGVERGCPRVPRTRSGR